MGQPSVHRNSDRVSNRVKYVRLHGCITGGYTNRKVVRANVR